MSGAFPGRGAPGPRGPPGPAGPTPTVNANATAVDGDEAAVHVTKTGTTDNVTFGFDFTLPRGDDGEPGPQGPPGVTPHLTAEVSSVQTGSQPDVAVVVEGTDEEPVMRFTFTLPEIPETLRIGSVTTESVPLNPDGTPGQAFVRITADGPSVSGLHLIVGTVETAPPGTPPSVTIEEVNE